MGAPARRLAAVSSAALLAVFAAAGCGGRAAAPAVTCRWIAGRPEPAFDPQGPPDALRWSLERLLARGLTAEDSSGAIVPGAAAGWEWSGDSLALRFRLRRGLAFPDGSPCRSGDFARVLAAGLARTDHASQAWLLGAVAGVERVRAGRPLPPLGIETPDESTLVLRLRRPEPALPARLALPGVSAPWSGAPGAGWAGTGGLGDYRVLAEDPGRSLTLARRAAGPGPDTIVVRFQPLAARVLTFLRGSGADLVWPMPAGLDASAVPPGLRRCSRAATPRRELLLVMRADLPPTSRLAARHALAHGVNRDRVLDALGPGAARPGEWPPGAGAFAFPAFDEAQVRGWMERARLGAAFHVTMAYDVDGEGARVARVLQGVWSRLGIYVELRPLRGPGRDRELLRGLSHLALVEAQSWSEDPAGTLSQVVQPLRGPSVGTFRTGWRTREFDGWIDPAPGRARQGGTIVSARLAEDLVVLPLAELPWTWLCRSDGAPLPFHPRYGPACAGCP
jgi:ABC-type transport system substrate-binding protein